MHQALAASVLGLTAMLGVIGVARAQPLATITIQAAEALSTKVQKALVELGVPRQVTLKAGQDPYAELRAHCGGSFTNDYLAHVKKLNDGLMLRPEPTDRSLVLPPCVRIAKNATVRVRPGDDVDSIVQRTLGVRSTDVIEVCDSKGRKPLSFATCRLSAAAALTAMNGGMPINESTLKNTPTLSVPTIAQPTTIVLKQGIDAATAVSRLNAELASIAVGTPRPIGVFPGAGLKLVQPMESDSPTVAGSACAPDLAPDKPWPFNSGSVVERISMALQEARRRGVYRGPSIVRVADTGFIGIGSFFPEHSVAKNTNDKADQPFDLDFNTFRADRFGIDAEDTGDVQPFHDDTYKLHGTQVANSALGGYELRSAYPAIYELVQVGFVKIFWKGSGAITVKDETLLQAMRHIVNHPDPRVVNFSVGAGDINSTRLFEDMLKSAAQLNFLAVLAAGNSSANISEFPTYPASYGGTGSDFSSWIITVGALGPDRRVAPFSNHSSGRVDLLAPGCRIPFAMDGDSLSHLHGTSLAAPLVSFTAAALSSLGVGPMSRVKLRIIASADFDHALAKTTRFGGVVLNVERAVSLFDDVVRVKGADRDMLGTWKKPPGEIRVCRDGELLNPRRILAISSYEEQGTTRVRILHADVDGRLADPTECIAGDERLDFMSSDGGEHHFGWSEIATLVPAYPFPKE